MINRPPFYLILLLTIGIMLAAVIQLEIISIAFQKLGLSPRGALLLMLGVLFGSIVNIPVGTLPGRPAMEPEPEVPPRGRLMLPAIPTRPGRVVIAVNLGGCIIPVCVCLYLLVRQLVAPLDLLLALPVVTGVCYLFSQPVRGLGIAMPMLLPPLVAVMIALILEPANAAPLAFSSGVIGVLLGADLLHLPEIRKLDTRVAAIGGAGTFDGVFLTGIIAVLLA